MHETRSIDVLVVGDANPDLVLTGDVMPRFGQAEQLLDRADLVLGGSAAITACGCARLGLRTTLVSRVGDDVFGAVVRRELTSKGVELVGPPAEPDGPTGLSVVLCTPQDRATLTLPGTIATVTAEDVTDAHLAAARHLHAASFFLQPKLAAGLPDLFRRAHAHGLTTSLDTNWDPSGQWAGVRDVLAYTDFFFPNRAELLAVAGHSGIDEAAAELVPLGTAVVLKDGADGARAWWSGGSCAAPALPVATVDTTGAGDSFNAGFLAGLLTGQPMARSVAYAAAAGSLSTQAPGGTAAQPDMRALQVSLANR